MNRDRFLELLNLFIDGELGHEGEEELFIAIEESEEYRRIYVEYSMMNQACSLLPEDYPVKRSGLGTMQMVYAFGGMAAALAFVFIGVQNASPLWKSESVESVVSEFAVNEGASSVVDFEGVTEPLSKSRVETVSFGDSVLRSGLGESRESSLSWRNGLLDRLESKSSLDHEMQLSLDLKDHELIFRKGRFIQGLDSAGLSAWGTNRHFNDDELSLESLFNSDFPSREAE